jgi:hypothetical protein
VIRRGFWIFVGAAGGIMGYRRASELTRRVSETLSARPRQPRAAKRHWARETVRFTSDVREGMDIYLSRREDTPSPTLGQGANAGANANAGSQPSARTQQSIQRKQKREDH